MVLVDRSIGRGSLQILVSAKSSCSSPSRMCYAATAAFSLSSCTKGMIPLCRLQPSCSSCVMARQSPLTTSSLTPTAYPASGSARYPPALSAPLTPPRSPLPNARETMPVLLHATARSMTLRGTLTMMQTCWASLSVSSRLVRPRLGQALGDPLLANLSLLGPVPLHWWGSSKGLGQRYLLHQDRAQGDVGHLRVQGMAGRSRVGASPEQHSGVEIDLLQICVLRAGDNNCHDNMPNKARAKMYSSS